MKKVFTVLGLFTILFTLASCQKEQTTVLRATISHYQSDSKVYIENKIAYWHESDQIWINGTTSTGLSTLTASQFEIVMPDSFEPTPGATLNAVYPASIINGTLSGNTIGVEIPDNQVYEVDGDGKQIVKAPMVAQATVNSQGGADVEFHNVCSLLKVMVHPNVVVRSITVSQAANTVSLAGNGTITFNGINPTLVMDANGSSTITLNIPEGTACRTIDGTYTVDDNTQVNYSAYYIVIPPYTDPTKLIVTVNDNPQTVIKRGQQSAHTLPANKIAEINCIENYRGIFSVSVNQKVSFAPGNLTGSYSFVSNQYAFGQEYTYNSDNISRYSNAMGPNYFLLSAGQWQYLLNRTDTYQGNTVNLKVRATINRVKGVIYLPDNWFSSMGCPVNIADNGGFNQNLTSVWNTLQENGAIFLPCDDNNKNHYWTSTPNQCLVLGNGEGLPVGSTGIIGTDGVNGVDYASGQIRLAHLVLPIPTQVPTQE